MASDGCRTRSPPWRSSAVGEDGQAAGDESRRIHSTSPGVPSESKFIFVSLTHFYAQLVVVGDQSSGKSSVLEGLTELPFPRDSILCTRFATQIIFRRAEQEGVSVSVIPSPSSDATREERLKAFRMEGLDAFSARTFRDTLSKVRSSSSACRGSR